MSGLSATHCTSIVSSCATVASGGGAGAKEARCRQTSTAEEQEQSLGVRSELKVETQQLAVFTSGFSSVSLATLLICSAAGLMQKSTPLLPDISGATALICTEYQMQAQVFPCLNRSLQTYTVCGCSFASLWSCACRYPSRVQTARAGEDGVTQQGENCGKWWVHNRLEAIPIGLEAIAIS